jgi:nucleotide-binding universal stress UspA family protein
MQKWAEKIIKKAEWAAKNEFLKFQSIIKKGDPAEIIVETAKKEGVDLIIMSKHTRGEIGRLLLGSVTDKVLRGVQCDVLVVHP